MQKVVVLINLPSVIIHDKIMKFATCKMDLRNYFIKFTIFGWIFPNDFLPKFFSIRHKN